MLLIKMLKLSLIITLYLYSAIHCDEGDAPIVKTQHGLIVGHYKKSYHGRLFSAFEGIPYAKPPTGNLRFEEPRESEPWLGNWIANTIHTCMQVYPTGLVVGEEDCLYINVYVPNLKPTSHDNLDVVVHIHGGGFIAGNPELGGPNFLMDRDVLFVNFNYRIGVMGFLSTEDDVIKGNMGLKDQVMALKWIQTHIKSFGGNPMSVTLTGVSAGASSTHFHYLSPLSKGLFHRGISQSGTAAAPYAIQRTALKETKKFALSVGCTFDSTKTIASCLRERSARQLVYKAQSFSGTLGLPFIILAPVVEKQSKSAFLAESPYQLIRKGNINDVPWMASMTTEEGILGVISFASKFEYLDKHWNDAAPIYFSYDNTCPKSQINNVSESIRKYYFKDSSVSMDSATQFIKLFGDRYFGLDLQKSTQMHAKVSKSPIYSYIYGYKQETVNPEELLGFKANFGVNHGADACLLYDVTFLGTSFYSQNLTKSDELIKNFFLDTVVTFAKTGKPVNEDGKWQQINASGDFGFLFIKNPDSMVMTYKNEIAPREFWKSLKLEEDELHEP